MRERDLAEDPHRRGRGGDETRPPEEPVSESVLALQRAAGNRAVSALLARQPETGGGAGTAVPVKEERGSSVTVGLGDGIVIPLESYHWDLKASELSVMFIDNPGSSELAQANVQGKHFATGFLSTLGLKSDMTDVMVSSISVLRSKRERPGGRHRRPQLQDRGAQARKVTPRARRLENDEGRPDRAVGRWPVRPAPHPQQ